MATFIDPVCGMEVEPKDAQGEEQFEDRTYYFCSSACQEKFAKDPQQYIGKFAETKKASSATP